jgi:hypothetical protein
MPKQGDTVRFDVSDREFWRCKFENEEPILHNTGVVEAILGRLSGNLFNRSECLMHPNHFAPVSAGRELTILRESPGTY